MTRKNWLGVATAALLVGSGVTFAWAQAPAPGGPGGPDQRQARMERFCADLPAHLAGKLAYAEIKLAITAQQKPAWVKFTDDVKVATAPLQKNCVDRVKARGTAAPTDPAVILTQREQAMGARLELAKAIHAAYDKLAPSLTADQKKQIAEMISKRGQRGGMRGHHGPMGGPGMHGGPQR